MPINLKINYDKFGFALIYIKRSISSTNSSACIKIKYMIKNEIYNIDKNGYASKYFTYSVITESNKQIIAELFNELNNKNIFESTKYLLNKYPQNIKSIINNVPSLVISNEDFLIFLLNLLEKLPSEEISIIKNIIKSKFDGMQKYLENKKLQKLESF